MTRILTVVSLLAAAHGAWGQTWTQTLAPSNYWQAVASSADGRVLAAAAGHGGSPGVVLISTNAGADWSPANVPMTNFYYGIAMSADGSRIATIYEGSGIYYSTNFGSNWTSNNFQFKQSFGALAHPIASSADGMKLTIAGSEVYLSSDGGVTWTSNNNAGTRLACIACSADGNKLAMTSLDTSSVYTSADGGLTWKTNTATNAALQDIASSADATHLIAAGSSQIPSLIYTSSNSGVTWVSNNAPRAAWQSVASSADGAFLAAALSSVSVSTNGAWTNVTPGIHAEIVSLASSADGGQIVAATGGEAQGFIYTLTMTRPPTLNASSVNNNMLLSWLAPSTNYALQQSSDLVSWADATNAVSLNLTNLNDQATVSPSNASGFYRLASP
jgi:hypothetical protein